MNACLGAFYGLEPLERKDFLKKIRKEQSRNPYYLPFVDIIKQFHPEYEDVFSSSKILI